MNVSITFTETWWYTWLLLPLLIMSARASDQAIGTLRVVFISKGMKLLAPAVGFVESIIWLLAVSQILKHVDNVFYFIAYGLGFALGNFIGITIEEKLSLGRVIVRIVSTKNTEELIDDMRENNFGLTVVEGHGSTTQIKLIFSVIARKHIKDLIELVQKWNPSAFYSIEEVKVAREGVFKPVGGPTPSLTFGLRKSK